MGIGVSVEKKLQTVFSLDNGATWLPLKAPLRDSDSKEFCTSPDEKSCRLNLHLDRSTPNSNEAAAGVVVAVGIFP